MSIIGAAAIAGGASLLGSILGNRSQKSANDTNKEIAQMNNEWSEKMMEKQNMYNIAQWQREADFSKAQQEYQNQWNLEQWNRENEYNSASAQAQRLKQAGLNPALVMGGNNAGSASSVSSAGASTPSGNSVGLPSPSSATVQPMRYEGFANAVNQALQVVNQQKLVNAQVSDLESQANYRDAMSKALVSKYEQETRGEKWRNDFNERNQDYHDFNMGEDYLKRVNDRILSEQQYKLVEQNRVAQALINEGLPEKLSIDIAVLKSQKALNEFNSSINVGKFMDEIKKRGIHLSPSWEKIIFGTLLGLSALKR